MRKRDVAPVIRIPGYVPDLTKKRPVPDDDVVHICKTRIRAVPSEKLDRKCRPLQSLIVGDIEYNIPDVDEAVLVKRNERNHSPAQILTGDDFLEQIDESVQKTRPIKQPIKSLTAAEFLEEKIGNVPRVVSPKRFLNQGKRRWKY